MPRFRSATGLLSCACSSLTLHLRAESKKIPTPPVGAYSRRPSDLGFSSLRLNSLDPRCSGRGVCFEQRTPDTDPTLRSVSPARPLQLGPGWPLPSRDSLACNSLQCVLSYSSLMIHRSFLGELAQDRIRHLALTTEHPVDVMHDSRAE